MGAKQIILKVLPSKKALMAMRRAASAERAVRFRPERSTNYLNGKAWQQDDHDSRAN